MKIDDDRVATISYQLQNEEGEVLEQVDEEEGLTYLHGHENIVPGLEEELLGKEPGDDYEVTVPPDDGYGEHVEELVSKVPRDTFPEDVELEPGMVFQAVKDDVGGDEAEASEFLVVRKIVGDEIEVDANHPLAGETLQFEGEVMEVREASDDEIEMGRPLRNPEGD